jgi:4-aminobutyrate aminotransferase/(S)-3-amino-2-methylpropionate transaminase
MDHTGPGALGGTFGGNPVACAAALAVLETIERENLCERAVCLGEHFRKRAANFPMVDDIRGIGAMQAVELVSAVVTTRLSQYCYEHGLITISAGTYGNVIRLLMPLVITDSQFEEGLDVLEAGFREVAD